MKISDMKVDLKRVDGSDLDVVNAARVSFDKESSWDVDFCHDGSVEQSLSERDAKLIRYLAKHNHWTPFGHVGAQFRIKAPVFVARQLVKHQIGLVWNETSRRYVDTAPEVYFPATWRARAENVKQGSADEAAPNQRSLQSLTQHHLERSLDLYDHMLKVGVAPEQARMVLPLNVHTEWVWTGSLAAWSRVCKLRLDPHAQAEVREVAQQFDALLAPAFPVAWAALMDRPA
ncbi:MAG: Pectobacterium phage phiTE [Pseudomonadota bacterium]|jgi:thymidylate synthase (FAD)